MIQKQKESVENRVSSSAELKKAAKETSSHNSREAVTILAIGEKGVGKTFTSMNFFKDNYIKTIGPKKGRKVLIFDTNGEFPDIEPLHFEQIKYFNQQKVVEIRRVLAVDPVTYKPLGVDGKARLLERIFEEQTPRDMGVFLEDLNSYITQTTSKQMIDVLTTNRHKAIDLFIHLQTFRAVPPRIWGNVNLIRLHKTGDGVRQVLNKVRNAKLTEVAYNIVEEKCKQDIRFYVWIDYDNRCITGKFKYSDLVNAATEYAISREKEKIKLIRQKNKISEEEAIKVVAESIAQEFKPKKS